MFVVLASLIPWIQRRKLTLDGFKGPSAIQIHTPLSKLLVKQPRYLFFLATVLIASFFFIFIRRSVDLLKIAPVPFYISFITEIGTCIVSYFLVPHIIPPQAFFLLAQLFISIRCISFASGCPGSFAVPLEALKSIGFTLMSMANAQIVATHGEPGLEFTTCAFVDIFRNGLAPALFACFSNLINLESILVLSVSFVLIFLMKYFIIDYKFDVLIKTNK